MANPSPGQTSQVMLDPIGRTFYFYYVKDDPVHKDLQARASVHKDLQARTSNDTTAVEVKTSSGHFGYFSFKLAPPKYVSHLDLHWPKGPKEDPKDPRDPAYSSVLAADKNLLLIRVIVPSLSHYYKVPHDLFVYTAAGPGPSLQPLPLYNECPREVFGRFCVSRCRIGILRLAGDEGHYIVADLIVDKPTGSGHYVAELCVFFSVTKTRTKWEAFTITKLEQSALPVRWITSTVLPFDGRFLCWVDYLSGVLLLSGFSPKKEPAVRFLAFPGEQYPDEVRIGTGRCCPGRFRTMSISQGMMCFVHIDNDFHERMHMEDFQKGATAQPRITLWTLDLDNDRFQWKERCHINVKDLWASSKYPPIPRTRLPEFPIINMDNLDRICCLLREKEFDGKAWLIEVDMKLAKLLSCTPYVNDEPYYEDDMELRQSFGNVPLLPLVLPEYLNSTRGNFKHYVP